MVVSKYYGVKIIYIIFIYLYLPLNYQIEMQSKNNLLVVHHFVACG